jgi:hypothetical protein
MPYSGKPCFSEATRGQETSRRHAWREKAFLTLSNAELVFLDPDNGLAGARIKTHSRKSSKYAFIEEVNGWLERGKSVVLYQHQRRKPLQQQALEQLEELSGLGYPGWAVTFHRMAVRIYFVLPATEEHKAQLLERTAAFLDTEWGRKYHFRPAAGCISPRDRCMTDRLKHSVTKTLICFRFLFQFPNNFAMVIR